MTRYDVRNEAIIAATPAEIIGAFLDEAAGRSQWWRPFVRMRQRGGTPLPEIGAAVPSATMVTSPGCPGRLPRGP